jgi:hypothetical protein
MSLLEQSRAIKFHIQYKNPLLPLLSLGILGGLLAASAIPNLDDAWLLTATGRVMDGAVVGIDLFETNPPLIYWVMAPAVWFGRNFGSDYYTTYCLWVALLGVASSWLVFRVLEQAGESAAGARLAALGNLILFVLVSSSEYGQRDALAYELAAPFLVAEACRAMKKRTPTYLLMAVAALATVGFLIKPYLAVVPAALFLYRIVRDRSLWAAISPDSVTMLTLSLLYVAYVWIETPAYFGLVKLMILAYPAYNSTGLKLLISFLPPLALALILWLVLARSCRPPAALAIGVLTLASVAFSIGAFTQLKGWYYHMLPSYLNLCGTCILFLALQTQSAPTRWFARWLAIGIPMAFILLGVARASYFHRQAAENSDVAQIIRGGDQGPFLAITSSMGGVFPDVTEMGVAWASGSPMQWMVPATVKLSQGTPKQREEGKMLQAISSQLMVRDLEKWQPHTIAIRTGQDQALSSPFDWISFFSSNEKFATLWAGYCAEGHKGAWNVYRRCKP